MNLDEEFLAPPDDDEDDCDGFLQPMLQAFALAIFAVGQDFLQTAEADRVPWGACNHHGFRPFDLMGYRAAQKVWEASRWKQDLIKAPTLCFPREGLASKVLQDRIRELVELGHLMSADTFRSRYASIPLMPRTGGAPRMVSLLQQRSFILGSDYLPYRHQPQILHDISRKIRKTANKEGSRLGLPLVDIHWNHTENVLCCFAKTVDSLLGHTTHSRY